ncbi:MAG: hypothetical protein M3406_12290 [Chloroflexota bacterium]|nr:hypothetical protein [Chloroflexota bacterium]
MISSDRAFEERVRDALSEPMTRVQMDALDARLERGRSRRVPFIQGKSVRRSLLLVAAVAIALPLAVVAGIVPGTDEVPPPADLEAGVAGLFAEDRCVDPAAAEQQVDTLLVDLGYIEWMVEHGTGAASTECVTAGLDNQARTVTLYMALSPQARQGLDAVREQLYGECRTRDEAVALVDAVLRDAGMEGYRIENGSLSVPNDRAEEIAAHVDSGCWVYSTSGWTADGTRVFWVSGN